jgi:hypothetical protein
MRYKLITLILNLLFFWHYSNATIRYVDSSHVGGTQNGTSWATAYAGLQAGIDAAMSGDSVWVASGTYQSPSFTGIVMKEGVKILGGFLNTHTDISQRNWTANLTTIKSSNYRAIINNGNNLTVATRLDGFRIIGNGNNNGSTSGGMYNNQSSPTIANCTFTQHLSSEGAAIFNRDCSPVITNCIFTGNYANSSSSSNNLGGAVQNFSSSPTISSCTFTSNISTGYGGAIYNINASSPLISYCTFTSNNCPKGGAIYSSGTANTVSIDHCTFTTNSGGQITGAAIYTESTTQINISNCAFSGHANTAIVNGANCNVDSCTFSSNTGLYSGGIYNYASLSASNSSFDSNTGTTTDGGAIKNLSSMSLNRCVFTNNIAGAGGGVATSGNATIKNCSFRGNRSGSITYGGGHGGGIYISAPCTLVNCLFSGNFASNGSALYNSGTSVKMINCTVANNRSPYDTYANFPGSNIYNWGFSTLQVSNSIIYGNQSGISNESMASFSATYSLVQGIIPTASSHNVLGDPQFVIAPGFLTAPFTNGDYRIQAASTCRNKGYNDSIPANTLTDLAGYARIVGDTVDMGAFEFLLLPPLVTLGNDTAICANSSLTLNAQNSGSSYLWSTGDTTQTINVNTAGIYSVLATNLLGTHRDTIVVSINALPIVGLGNDTTVCGGLLLNAQNPGSNFYWSNMQFTQTIMADFSATYIVTVINSNGCTNKDTIVVTVKPKPLVNLGNDQQLCHGQSATLNAQNMGSAYLWNTGATAQTIDVSNNGTYHVKVTGANLCVSYDTVNIIVNPLPVVFLGSDTVFCSGNSLLLNAQNSGVTYLWNNNAISPTINVSSSGIYAVKVTTANNCVGRDTIQVLVHASPIVNLGNDTAICPGISLVLNGQNTGATYLWSNAAATQTTTVSAPGSYHILVTDANLCQGRDTIQISVASVPLVQLGNDTSFCAGNVLVLNAQNPGAGFLWSNGTTTQILPINTAGTYHVTVTNTFQCRGSDTIQVAMTLLPTISLGNDTGFCYGNSIMLNAENTGLTYLWSTGATTQTTGVTTSGIYYVAVTNADQCTGRDTIVVTVRDLPLVNLGNDTAFCGGNSLVLDAENAGGSYLWNTTAITQTEYASASGSYNVSVTDQYNCMGYDTITITVFSNPVVQLGNDTTFCAGNSLVLDAQHPGNIFLWNDLSTTQAISVTAGGSYYVMVTDTNGCQGTDTLAIMVNSIPVVLLGSDIQLNAGDEVTLDAGNPGNEYQWSTGATTQTILVNTSGIYTVNVTNNNGCTGSDTINVLVNPLGINDSDTRKGEVRVSPNPTTNDIFISSSDLSLLPATLHLTDWLGKVLRSEQFLRSPQRFSLSGLARGVYTLQIGEYRKIRIVKQ